MDESTLQQRLDFAVKCAQEAGRATLAYFGIETPPERKPDNTPVTAADRAAEQLIRSRIERVYPDDGIVGEELGVKAGRTGDRWIIDPIDGTVSFMSGVPLYAVLIGLESEGKVVVGVIHLPALHETVYAARGLGCRWNGRPARVSEVANLADARLTITSPRSAYAAGKGAAYERLRRACYVDRGWSDAYAYALLATGRAEIVLDPAMQVWDTAALVPVVVEAGGTLTDWEGRADHTRPEVVATNGHLFEAVMRELRAADGG